MAFALDSYYMIDGIRQALTPSQVLSSCGSFPETVPSGKTILDESLDAVIGLTAPDSSHIGDYLEKCLSAKLQFPLGTSAEYTGILIARELVSSLRRKGHFALSNLGLSLDWKWSMDKVGRAGAFYNSVLSAANHIESLGIRLDSYSLEDSEEPSLNVGVSLSDNALFGEENPVMEAGFVCPDRFVPEPSSWIVYMPFDTSEHRLGGSLLGQACGIGGGAAELSDADYFMDCFEVVREFCNDRLLLSFSAVGEGGLLKTLHSMGDGKVGSLLDVSELSVKCGPVNALFSELPGAVFQIADSDFDYMDAQLLLQDVAFFPLGHPVPGDSAIHVKSSAKTQLQNILDSLLFRQGIEGED